MLTPTYRLISQSPLASPASTITKGIHSTATPCAGEHTLQRFVQIALDQHAKVVVKPGVVLHVLVCELRHLYTFIAFVASLNTISKHMWEQLKGQRKGSNRSMIKFKNHGLIAVGKRVVGAAWSTIQQIVHSIAGTLFNNPVVTKRVMEAKLPPIYAQHAFMSKGALLKNGSKSTGVRKVNTTCISCPFVSTPMSLDKPTKSG